MKINYLVLLFSLSIILSTNLHAQIAMTDDPIKPLVKDSFQTKAETIKNDKPPAVVKEEEAVFVDNNNKIYVNKNLPIYLKFSTTPDGQNHDLKSLSHPEDAEPLYLDTEGPNYIRTKWAVDPETKQYAYPLREIQMELYADSKPPIISPIFKASESFKNAEETYYGKDLEIFFKEWDEQAGVKNSFWSLNNNVWKSGKTNFENQQSDSYSFTYYAVDNVNNYSEESTVNFVYDKTAPTTELLMTKEGSYIFGPITKIQFKVDEKHSGVKSTYFKIGELSEIKVKSDQVLPASLSDGEYKVNYYSVDNVNNEEELREMAIYLDKIAPETFFDATTSYKKGDVIYVAASSKISLTATDNKAGVRNIYFSTRGVTNEIYLSEFSMEEFHGPTEVKFNAEDIVTNVEKTNTQKIFVDTLRPSTQIEFMGDYFEVANRYYVNETTKIKLKASDLNAGVAYTEFAGIGNDFSKYDMPFSLVEEGYFGMMYRSVDQVENAEYSKSIDLYLDKKGPEIVYNFSNRAIGMNGGVPIFPSGTRLFLGATDDLSGTNSIAYQVNDQSEVYYSSPKTIDISEKKSFAKGQSYDVLITTTDLVNNKTVEVIAFEIED